MKYLGCLWRVSGKIDLSLYSIIPLIYTSCNLPEACQEIKVGPYFICLEPAKLFKAIPDVCKVRSSLGGPQDTYWSMPKFPLQATTFFHVWHSGSAASSHSSMLSHLSLNFRNLWYNPSFTVQSMCGSSMYGMYMVGGNCGGACGWIVWNDASASDF